MRHFYAEPEDAKTTIEDRVRNALYNRLDELDKVVCANVREVVEVTRATVDVADALNRAFGPMRNGGTMLGASDAGTEGEH